MNRLGQARGSGIRGRRVFHLSFSTALVILAGSPLTTAMAEPVPLLRDVSQSRPYVDCGAAPGRIAELENRLAERRKAIDKTKSMLPGLEDGSKKAWTKADQIMAEAPANLMTSFASDYMTTLTSLKNRIRALRNSGASKEKVELWLKSMKGMEDAGSFLKKAPASYEAGVKFGLEHQAEIGNLQKEIARTHEFLVDSGLAEEVGGSFAKEFGGPLGKLAYDAGVTSINLMVTTEEAFIEADAARRVQSAVDAMEWGYSRDYSEMVNLEALRAENCKPLKDQMAENNSPPEPPAPSAVEEPPVSTAPAGASAGPDMGAAILVGGAAAAGAAALAVGLSGAASSGVDCGAAPTGFGSAWWSEYSAWCTCMDGTPVVSTTQCVQ